MDSVVESIRQYVETEMSGESSGHDWWHVWRVWQLARRIGASTKADMFVVELAALLHDIADWKFHDGDESVGPARARQVMTEFKVDEAVMTAVGEIIQNLSYKGALVKPAPLSLEGQVVQDADRLDAIGAVGIARVFMFSGARGRSMHDPDQKPILHQDKESYFKTQASGINYFHEKLLLLKDRLNLPLSREIAAGRHQYMVDFLDRFDKEWHGIL